KSMLPVLGQPIAAHVLGTMAEAGVRRFVIVVGPDDGGMRAYFERVAPPGVDIRFAVQERATGTVDALTLAAPQLDGPFLLSSVDNLTSAAHVRRLIARFAADQDAITTLSLLPATSEQIRRSAGVVIDGEWITAIEEKPEHPPSPWAAIMIYAFSHDYLSYLARVPVSLRGEREIVSGIQAALAEGRRVSYVTTDRRLHLTRERDLLAINLALLAENGALRVPDNLPASVQLLAPARIDPGVSVGAGARIGPNVYLESGAIVGAGATVANSLILAGGVVAPGETCDGIIVDSRARVVVALPETE
ncbi:MAG: NTP transferase domain-containing protein, partial [Anaerolineae bacterium]|nr:NTP transferase domain-containing protein [Anaerolineae bacterium]